MLHMHGDSNLAPSHMVKLAAARKNQALKTQQNNLKQGCQRVIHKRLTTAQARNGAALERRPNRDVDQGTRSQATENTTKPSTAWPRGTVTGSNRLESEELIATGANEGDACPSERVFPG